MREKVDRFSTQDPISSKENSPPADPYEPKPDYHVNNNGLSATYPAHHMVSVQDLHHRNQDRSLNQESTLPPIPPPDYEEYLRSMAAATKNSKAPPITGYVRSSTIELNERHPEKYCNSSPHPKRGFSSVDSPYVTKIHF